MIREYDCLKCHKRWEVELEDWEDVVLKCPICGGMDFEDIN